MRFIALLLLFGELPRQGGLLLRLLFFLIILLPAGAIPLLLFRLEGLAQFSLLLRFFSLLSRKIGCSRRRFSAFRFRFLFSHTLRR